MSDPIVEYSVSVGFDTALKKLDQFEKKMTGMQRTQAKMQKAGTLLDQVKYKAFKVNLKEQEAATKNEIANITKVSQALRKTQEKDLKQQTDRQVGAIKTANRLIAQENMTQSARRRQAVGNITVSTGAGKAKDTALAQMLREQEVAANKLATAERNRVKQLDTALQKAKDEVNVRSIGATTAEKARNAAVLENIQKAKTAQEVRAIVATENRRLRLANQQTNQMQRQSYFMQRMTNSSKQLAGNMLSAFAVAGVGVGIVKIGQDFERANNTLTAITHSTEGAAKEMQYLRDFTYQMGVPLRETAKDYAKLRASAEGLLPVQQQKALFEDLTKAAVVMGTTSDDTSGIIKALTQMLSKQKISAEEYRGQLGDRMPIAIQAMVKAAVKAGVITDELTAQYGSASGALEKLMADGKLYAKDILPYFGEEIRKITEAGLETSLQSNMNAMNRLMNVIETTADAIFQSGLSDGLTDFFNTSASFIKDNQELWNSLGKIVGSAFKGLTNTLKFLKPIFTAIGSTLKALTDTLGDFSAAIILLNPMLIKLTWGLTEIATSALFGKKALDSLAGSSVLTKLLAFGRVATIFGAIAASVREAAFWIEEFINLFTQDKIGVLYDPRTDNYNISDIMKKMYDFSNPASFAASTGRGLGQDIYNEIKLYIDGEQAAQAVVKTDTYKNSTNGMIQQNNQ